MAKINANTKVLNNDETKIELEILGLSSYGSSSDEKNAYVAFKYFDKNFECLSEWEKDELSSFTNFLDKMNKLQWKEIKRYGGLRFKNIDNANGIPNNDIKQKLSKDITFCEFRITDRARVVGFRINSVFFLCWLDRNHRICPQ